MKFPVEIEAEIVRRIKGLRERAASPGASVRSKAKFGASAEQLSDLLGWMRK